MLTFSKVLSSQEDILSNVMWRFLQLRGYIDEKHQLTAWGKCLDQALSALDPTDKLGEAVFIAIEMLRWDLLNTKHWFSHVSGGPMRGSGRLPNDLAPLMGRADVKQRRIRLSTCWCLVWRALQSCSIRASDIPVP